MTTGPPPRFGVGFQSDKSPGDYGRLAAIAEHYGFDVVSVFGDLYFQPPIVPLLAMARVTRRVLLGAACFNPFTLHPVEIAGQVAALDVASGGRAYLGLARGSWLEELAIDQHDGVSALAEAVAVVQALLAGDREGVDGTRFRLPPGARLRYRPLRTRVPVLIGTWGPRLAHLAGGFADEVKVGGSANAAFVPVMREWIRSGAESAQRLPGEVGVVMGAVTVVDHDASAARRRARTEVAMYLDVVGLLDPTIHVDPLLLDALRVRLLAGDTDGAAALISDELLDNFAFAGTPAQVAAQVLSVVEAGATRVEFGTPHGLTDALGVTLLGGEVIPRVRAELA